MEDHILESFLTRQHEEAKALEADSDILEVHAIDGPPAQHYIITLHAKGLVLDETGNVVEADRCVMGIRLSDAHLRRIDQGVLTYLGPHARPWHPNILHQFVCVHVDPGVSLCELIYTAYELWTWHLYYTGDEGLNRAASQWARHQEASRFPVDRRPLKRRVLPIEVVRANEESRL